MKMRILAMVGTLLCLPMLCMASLGGRVSAVTDGDTITVMDKEHGKVTVRLADIDAPEDGQPYGERSTQELIRLTYGQLARVDVRGVDRYGRSLGRVFIGTSDVNASMVKRGAAWVYRQYSQDPSLLPLESQAQAGHVGLWSLPPEERVPPWDWRKLARSGSSTGRHGNNSSHHTGASSQSSEKSASEDKASASDACGNKRHCSKMSSCAEAKHYLNDCGVSTLDRDSDGIPCESLCGK